jgi:enamine deaminase RidA (YjgF/YER057c/UK114 family)
MTVSYDNPAQLAEPLGKYSHVSHAGGLVFVAGQVGIHRDGTLAGPDLPAQMRQVFANIGAALAARGAVFSDVMKFTTYLTDASLIAPFYETREALFAKLFADGQYPPNTLLVIDRLVRPEYVLEIEAVAHVEASEAGRASGS